LKKQKPSNEQSLNRHSLPALLAIPIPIMLALKQIKPPNDL
jgi:hypothetical protein